MATNFGVRNIPIPAGTDVPDRPATWQAAVTRFDLVGMSVGYVADASALTAITNPVVGMRVRRADNGIEYRYDGSQWKAWSSPLTAYTPILTGMVVGTGGTNTAEWWFDNGIGRIRGRVIFGSSGQTFPTTPQISLPSVMTLRAPVIANEFLAGIVTLFDAGVAVQPGFARYPGTSTDSIQLLRFDGTGGTGAISTSSPWSWGATDGMSYDLIIPVA